uniref:alpha-amylase family glycosyl hydrolase n=1 Tax=Staphylococcus aureus TaxID=1280 RepID=UPI00210BBC0A
IRVVDNGSGIEALKNIGREPAPKSQEVKSHDTFEHNGQVYQSKDFRGESKQGPVVAIFGDTKTCSNERVISRDADVMVHEATYIDGETWTNAKLDFHKLKKILMQWQRGIYDGGGWNALFWCNHDQPRVVSRFGDNTSEEMRI